MNEINLDHIAILVKSINLSLEKLKKYNFFVDTINEFPSEGTKEVYISKNKNDNSKILLIEAISKGVYLNTLKKRGTGIHHIGINVTNIKNYLHKLKGSGWYLHLNSLNTYSEERTIWLSRAKTPILIEVSENNNIIETNSFIKKIELDINNENLLSSLNLDEITCSNYRKNVLFTDKESFFIEDLI